MAATALIRFRRDNPNPTEFPNGEAVVATVGDEIRLLNSDNTGVLSWQIDLVYTPPGSGTSEASPLIFNNSSSVPDSGAITIDEPGGYRFVLKVWDAPNRVGTPSDVDIRNILVPESNGFLAPPSARWPPPLPPLESGLPGSKPDENNINGQPYGWAGTGNDGLLLDFIKNGGGGPIQDGSLELSKLVDAEQYRVVGRVDAGEGAPKYLTPLELGSVVALAGNVSMSSGNISVSGDWTGSTGNPGMSTSLSAQRRIRDISVDDTDTVTHTVSMFGGGAGWEEYAVEVIVVNTALTQVLYQKSIRVTVFRDINGDRTEPIVKPIDDDYFDVSGHELEIELSDNNLLATYTNNSGSTVRATMYIHGTNLGV